jgi:endonuclease/exonuclease/phosphatase family metal-dependent hydrolase
MNLWQSLFPPTEVPLLKKLTLAALAALMVVPVAPAVAQKKKPAPSPVTVMSRNLYLGADLIPLASASSQEEFERGAAGVWKTVTQTNFPVRARAIAREIRTTKPHVIGLQEAAIWRTGPKGGGTAGATKVEYDFTKILLAELKKLGQDYRVVVNQPWFDLAAPTADGMDARLTQQDAILVRKGVSVAKTGKGRFSETFKVNTFAGEADSKRGWVFADIKQRNGKTFRVVNTHLEAYLGDVRAAQARQLVGTKGPVASRRLPSLVIGDLNSDPRDDEANAAAYKAVANAGFVNVFRKLPATSGQNETVDNPVSELKRSIDHIMTRPAGKHVKVLQTRVVGNKASDRIQGLWPSDHAGVVARLQIR